METREIRVQEVKDLYRDDSIGWMMRERVLTLALVAATGLALYVCYLLALPFLPAVAWALALAVVAHPLHARVAGRIRNANLAATATVLVVSGVIVAPAIFVLGRLVSQATSGVQMIQQEAATGRWRSAIGNNPHVAAALNWIQSHIDARGAAQHAATALSSWLSSAVAGSISSAAGLLITLFVLFFFFRDQNDLLSFVRSLVPLSEPEADRVITRVADTVHATVYGTILVALIRGALGGLMFWWLRLPSPLFWGVVMAVASLIPFVGPFLIWIPAALLLVLEGSWGKAAILTVWWLGVISIVDNMLYPIVVGKRLQLHTLSVFFSILGGLSVFGASGLILGPIALAITVALLDMWRRRMGDGRTAAAGVCLGD